MQSAKVRWTVANFRLILAYRGYITSGKPCPVSLSIRWPKTGGQGGVQGIRCFQIVTVDMPNTVLEGCIATMCSFGRGGPWPVFPASWKWETPHCLQPSGLRMHRWNVVWVRKNSCSLSLLVLTISRFNWTKPSAAKPDLSAVSRRLGWDLLNGGVSLWASAGLLCNYL